MTNSSSLSLTPNPHGGDIRNFTRRFPDAPKAILDLSVNTWPFGVPKELTDLLTCHLGEIVNYPDIHAESLCQAIAARHGLSSECVIPANGSIQLIYALCSLSSYSGVLTFDPTFNEYRHAAALYRKAHRSVMGGGIDSPGVSLDQLERKIHDHQLLFLCHPNNPTGILRSPGFLQILLDRIRGLHSLLIVDEAFIDFIPEQSLARWIEREPQLIVLRSLTKYFGLAGLRLGYALAHPDRIKEIVPSISPWSVNTFAQIAGSWVLSHEDLYDRQRAGWLQETSRMMNSFARFSQIRVFSSQTSFFIIKTKSENISEQLENSLGQSGILIRRCDDYIGLDCTYFRIGTRTDQENQRFLNAVESFFGGCHEG